MRIALGFLIAAISVPVCALDPSKALTQYSKTVWTQQPEGLPQDTVRAIAQTPDGYLWLGTDEGLARFDGYEFVRVTKDDGQLPSNSITSLATGKDGSLWIGTPAGLTRRTGQTMRTYGIQDGLPNLSISALTAAPDGTLWIIAGGHLTRFDGSKFQSLLRGHDVPLASVRTLAMDGSQRLYVGGSGSVLRMDSSTFRPVLTAPAIPADFPTVSIHIDRQGTLWALGTRGLVARAADGSMRRYGPHDGIPDSVGQGAILEDREGNLWTGTGNRLARYDGNGHFLTLTITAEGEPDSIRTLFEDREGNLWVGSNNGLTRFRDDAFTVYGRTEGLPDDGPNTVYEDAKGRVWVGLMDSGVLLLSGEPKKFSEVPGAPRNRVFQFRETRAGELLIAAGNGLTIWKDGASRTFVPYLDPLGRKYVYDALEGPDGRIWLALPGGLGQLDGNQYRIVIEGGPLIDDSFVTLTLAPDGSLWAGTHRGLWSVKGETRQQFTERDGLASNQVRTLSADPDGSLWIGTFGGGLSRFRNGTFVNFTAKDGLLSDNIAKIIDDGESLWLSTTRGICRVSKAQLADFSEHRLKALTPLNYGMADGLRSPQYSPSVGGGGGRHRDGSLWFVTSRGIAVFQPGAFAHTQPKLNVGLVEMSAEGRQLDWLHAPQIPEGAGRLQIRYSAIHLAAPEQVEYSYKLDGLDSDWVNARNRRGVNYSGLTHGHYRFHVRAALAGQAPSEVSYEFELLPRFYETIWFRVLCALAAVALGWAVYAWRAQQIRSRFGLVLQERARLAREVHDTLAQGFVGISSQLEVVDMSVPREAEKAHQALDLARRMARHSLTEARRSVMDLRAAALEEQDLGSALKSGARLWTAGTGVKVEVDVVGETNSLPEDVAHHVLRIAQEAIANVTKHAHANRVALHLRREPGELHLNVEDNGCGFTESEAFTTEGHFGLIGMRERAERVGGELKLQSSPGKGTQLEVTVPLA